MGKSKQHRRFQQLELFPDLYPPTKEEEHSDEWVVEQYNRNRDSKDHITGSGEIKQEWPGFRCYQ